MLTSYINIQQHCASNVVAHMFLFSFVDNMQMGMYMKMVMGSSKESFDGPCTMVCLTYT